MKTAPYTTFGETRSVPIKIANDDNNTGKWDEELWIERGEDWYALDSPELRKKRVRIIEREVWLRSPKMSNEELNPALRQTDVRSRLSFEEMVWKKRFPDEDFDSDNFYDWAAENGLFAVYMCIEVARDLGL